MERIDAELFRLYVLRKHSRRSRRFSAAQEALTQCWNSNNSLSQFSCMQSGCEHESPRSIALTDLFNAGKNALNKLQFFGLIRIGSSAKSYDALNFNTIAVILSAGWRRKHMSAQIGIFRVNWEPARYHFISGFRILSRTYLHRPQPIHKIRVDDQVCWWRFIRFYELESLEFLFQKHIPCSSAFEPSTVKNPIMTDRFGLKRIIFVIFYTFSVSVDVVMFHWFMFQRGYHFGSSVWVSVRNHVLGVTMASTVKQQFGGAKIFLVHTHTPAITLSVDVDHHWIGRQRVLNQWTALNQRCSHCLRSPHALIYFIFEKKVGSTSRWPQQTQGSVKFVTYFYFLFSIVFVYWIFGHGNCGPWPIRSPCFHSTRTHQRPPTGLSFVPYQRASS